MNKNLRHKSICLTKKNPRPEFQMTSKAYETVWSKLSQMLTETAIYLKINHASIVPINLS